MDREGGTTIGQQERQCIDGLPRHNGIQWIRIFFTDGRNRCSERRQGVDHRLGGIEFAVGAAKRFDNPAIGFADLGNVPVDAEGIGLRDRGNFVYAFATAGHRDGDGMRDLLSRQIESDQLARIA